MNFSFVAPHVSRWAKNIIYIHRNTITIRSNVRTVTAARPPLAIATRDPCSPKRKARRPTVPDCPPTAAELGIRMAAPTATARRAEPDPTTAAQPAAVSRLELLDCDVRWDPGRSRRTTTRQRHATTGRSWRRTLLCGRHAPTCLHTTSYHPWVEPAPHARCPHRRVATPVMPRCLHQARRSPQPDWTADYAGRVIPAN